MVAADPFGDVLNPPFPTQGPHAAWFIETHCTHTDGELLGQPMLLERWQKWVLNEMFRLDPETGLRYWREFVLMVPRGNGKSALVSGLGFYFLIFDGEGAPEVYSSAWGEDQATAVFAPAQLMWESSPMLQAKCQKFAKAFTCSATKGSWKITSRIAITKQGKKPYALLNDEYHVHQSPELRDTFIRGMHKRKQPIAVDITTEGKDRNSPLGELQQGFWDAVSRGVASHEEVTPFLHVVRAGRSILIRWGVPWDRDADPENPEIVRACNPLSVIDPVELIQTQLLAPGKREADFRTYHLNQLSESESGISGDQWDLCRSDLRLDAGQEVCIGVDLAIRSDWSAVVVAGRVGDRVVLEPYMWAPPEDGSDLDIRATVESKVRELMERYRVQRIGVDKYMASTMLQDWQMLGWPVEDFPMHSGSMCPASVTMLDAVMQQRLSHDGNGDLRVHALNAVMRDTDQGRWRFDKKKDDRSRKIDAFIASIIALQLVSAEGDSSIERYGLFI